MTYRFTEAGSISIHDDRWFIPPWGVNGGEPAQCSWKALEKPDGTKMPLPAKCDRTSSTAGPTSRRCAPISRWRRGCPRRGSRCGARRRRQWHEFRRCHEAAVGKSGRGSCGPRARAEVVCAGALARWRDEAIAFARCITDKPRACIAASKSVYQRGVDATVAEGVAIEFGVFEAYMGSEPYGVEGYTAYREGRVPGWKGR